MLGRAREERDSSSHSVVAVLGLYTGSVSTPLDVIRQHGDVAQIDLRPGRDTRRTTQRLGAYRELERRLAEKLKEARLASYRVWWLGILLSNPIGLRLGLRIELSGQPRKRH